MEQQQSSSGPDEPNPVRPLRRCVYHLFSKVLLLSAPLRFHVLSLARSKCSHIPLIRQHLRLALGPAVAGALGRFRTQPVQPSSERAHIHDVNVDVVIPFKGLKSV